MKETVEVVEIQRKLSVWRVFIALLLLGAIIYYMVRSFMSWQEERSVAQYKPWFGAYVDVTAKPSYTFERLGSTKTPHVILAFIVSSHTDPCVPTWGGYHTLEEARVALDLDRRIARLKQQNGSIAISFGGALNSELSLKCKDKRKLLQAYKSVIDRYAIDTIDLDLEHESLRNTEASNRRSEIIAELQSSMRKEGKGLAVWLTLPVAPQGLTKEGTDAVAMMLAHKVDLAGVNVMTMDYGNSKDEKDSMFEASKKALLQSHRQLGILYEQAGIYLNNATLWRKLGATPMIGQNDVLDEVFTHDDAVALNNFAHDQGLGRMSMWSANRDLPCGENYVDVTTVSDSCSGVDAHKLAFSQVLSDRFNGDLSANATIITVEDKKVDVDLTDIPANSPYQIWDESGAYLQGTKVVWHHNVYEAKWWTRGDIPDNPVLQEWETPWLLIGPVLPGEKPIKLPTLPKGTYPEWSGKVEYETGTIVLFDGIPYEAKWWNMGESPAVSVTHPDSSPWKALTQEQISAILEKQK